MYLLPMVGYVYKITNKETGQVYYGLHHNTTTEDDYMGSSGYFRYEKRRHPEDFSKEIVMTCDTEEDLCKWESFWIATSKYLGEQNVNGNRGAFFHRDKIPSWNQGLKMPQDFKDKISRATKGENNPFYGKTHTEDVKNKISEANKGRRFDEEVVRKTCDEPKKKKVVQRRD